MQQLVIQQWQNIIFNTKVNQMLKQFNYFKPIKRFDIYMTNPDIETNVQIDSHPYNIISAILECYIALS
jgi:hypothetical protein